MQNFIQLYQYIPYHLNPVAFSVFGWPVDWYSLMYLVGFLVVYFLLRYRIGRGEVNVISNSPNSSNSPNKIPNVKLEISNKFQNSKLKIQNSDTLLDLMLVAFGGLLIGGRLGYVFFYNFGYYWRNPLAVISPFDPVTHQFIGIYGMSYHGALLGALCAAYLYTKAKKLNFWQWANFVAPAVPAGYFFGRIGNFLNGELYGRATVKIWGMYFPGDPFGLLRHPSELYEALLEGLILFLILWKIRNNEKYKHNLLALYLIGYALARIIAEFFRQPDVQIGYLPGGATLGQILSLAMIFGGISLIYISRKRKNVI